MASHVLDMIRGVRIYGVNIGANLAAASILSISSDNLDVFFQMTVLRASGWMGLINLRFHLNDYDAWSLALLILSASLVVHALLIFIASRISQNAITYGCITVFWICGGVFTGFIYDCI